MACRSTYAFAPRTGGDVAIHCTLLICLSLTAPVLASDRSHRTCTATEPITEALFALGQRTGATITYDSDSLPQVKVCHIGAELEIGAALEQMLAGTGLTALRTGTLAYDLRSAPVNQRPATTVRVPTGVEATNDAGTLTVQGTRIGASRISPADVIFSANDYDQVGFATVGDAVVHAAGQMSSEFVWGDGAQFADLRGLGINFTAVRINRGWLAPTAISGVAFDLNAIPLSFVERVEAVDEMRAAELGLRALGGTIDIELKKPGAPLAWYAIGGAAGGGMQRQVAASVGTDRARWSAGLWVDYFDRKELPGQSRDFSRDQNYSEYGGPDYRSRATWPGNVRSTTGAPLPGLSASFAAVPDGTPDRVASIGDFQDTAGEYRLDSLRRFSSILPATNRRSVLATVQGKSRSIAPFAELMGVWRDCDYRYTPPTVLDALVPADNPYNPFGAPVYVSRLFLEIEPRQVETESRWWRLASGLRGQLGAWQWSVTGSRSEEFATRWANHALDDRRVAAALASTDPATALNMFQAGAAGSPELMDSLQLPPSAFNIRSFGTAAAATLRGPLFASVGGDAIGSFDAQWRDERSVGARTVATAQAGLDIPLWVLEAHLSTRWDRFSDIGDIATSSYALRWRPLPGLELHASLASQFRAPSLFEMFGPGYEVVTAVPDRRRGGEVVPVIVRGGNNPELPLARGDSTSFGFTVSPSALPKLTLQADYWLKQIDSRIMTPPLSLVLEHEAEFAGLIQREAPSAADLAAGRPGVIRSVDISMTHVGGLEASGIDASVSYRFLWDIDATLAATWMDQFATVDVPGTAPTTRLGVANPRGTVPRWRGALSLKWQSELASAALQTRLIGSYDDMVANRRTGRQLHPQAFVDLQASMSVEALWPDTGLSRGVRVTVGALNVLDTPPQYSASGLDVGFDPSLSDPRQRFWFMRLEKQF
ncbi:TonB-dependent receptor domain-containing protein [Peristeroidobacter soli]|uniref:TonB-dependent receptor domain-containing protein n=1 Tax=Peristeroidobacter soli TaxID=2497877 RepID=UPI0013007673|nr:TonB-dependent receptor [Peristeroidobacter soli]